MDRITFAFPGCCQIAPICCVTLDLRHCGVLQVRLIPQACGSLASECFPIASRIKGKMAASASGVLGWRKVPGGDRGRTVPGAFSVRSKRVKPPIPAVRDLMNRMGRDSCPWATFPKGKHHAADAARRGMEGMQGWLEDVPPVLTYWNGTEGKGETARSLCSLDEQD